MSELEFMRRYAEKLNRALDYTWTTQKELSKLTGISESTISSYCRATRMPALKNAINIANALSYDIGYFIDADEPIE